MRNIKKKDNEQWIELCEYVKKEILEYDDNMKFPQYLALKLQGIKRGEHIANNNHEAKANYDDYTILCTFKLCKKKIVSYLHNNESKIHDEKHKIKHQQYGWICQRAIQVENSFGDVKKWIPCK